MDMVFSMDEAARANFLQALIRNFNCTYICVWAYLPQPFNCLVNLDGVYSDQNTQASCSSGSGSIGVRHFHEYKQLLLNVENHVVPGHAFKNHVSYLELHESELQTHASAQVQKQFYSVAGIKRTVFMGSSNGEIELGFSYIFQVNIADEQMKLQTFPTSQASSMEMLQQTTTETNHPQFQYQNPNSPSSSSSSFFFNLPTIPHFTHLASTPLPSSTARSHGGRLPFPASSSSFQRGERSEASAFKQYGVVLRPISQSGEAQRRGSMVKRSILLYRRLNLMKIQERIRASRSTTTQLLHMISERKRREKLKESFQALRSLLPPGTKKDRASVLASAREYLTKLRAEAWELGRKNQVLEAQIWVSIEASGSKDEAARRRRRKSSMNERFKVRVSHYNLREWTSTDEEDQVIIDLEISVGGEHSMADTAIRVLEFLRSLRNFRVLSINGKTHLAESSFVNRLTFRLSMNLSHQNGEWDKSAFQEAVRRIVSDLTSPPFEE